MPSIFAFLGDMSEQNRQIESVISFDHSVVHFLIQRSSFGKYSSYCFLGYFCSESYPHKLQKFSINYSKRVPNDPLEIKGFRNAILKLTKIEKIFPKILKKVLTISNDCDMIMSKYGNDSTIIT